jgi:phosphohistidine phosphatase
MNHLWLLRHGVAQPHGTPGIPDDERQLTPKGEKKVEVVAKAMNRLGICPDRILTSPLPRAHRTAEIVAEELEVELEDVAILRPDNSAGSILEWVVTRPEGSLLLVGHNPNLTELLGRLLGFPGNEPPFELAKAGLAALSALDGKCHLDLLLTARTISRLD